MPITASELRHDTYNFVSKKIGTIFLISIFVTFINILIDIFIQPDMHIMSIIENHKFMNATSLLDLINRMSLEEKYELLKYSIFKIIELLMNKTLLLASMITLISAVSNSKKKSIISLIFSLLSLFSYLLILNGLITLTVQLGYMLFIFPGILLSMMLSLSPIIFYFKKCTLINSIRFSMYISWKNINIIGPGILLWICSKFILTTLLSHFYLYNKNIIFLISNISLNVLFSILIIYLFRFYMLFSRS